MRFSDLAAIILSVAVLVLCIITFLYATSPGRIDLMIY